MQAKITKENNTCKRFIQMICRMQTKTHNLKGTCFLEKTFEVSNNQAPGVDSTISKLIYQLQEHGISVTSCRL